MAAFLMADWQAIPYDPCTEKSPFHHPDIIRNRTFIDTYPPSLPYEMVNDLEISSTQGITKRKVMVLTEEETSIAISECDNATFRGHPCHWIPESSIFSSYYCKDCQPICRSPLRSLNLIQFFGGVFLIYFLYPMNATAAPVILSDGTSIHAQVQITLSEIKTLQHDHLLFNYRA